MKKSSLKCTWKYAADNFQDKKIVAVQELTIYLIEMFLMFLQTEQTEIRQLL